MDHSGEGEGKVKVRYSFIAGVGIIDDLRYYRGDKIVRTVERLTGMKIDRKILGPYTAVDIYYSLFLPAPLLEDNPPPIQDKADAVRYTIIQKLLSDRTLSKVRNYTVADSLTSVVASVSIMEKLSKLLPKSPAGSKGDNVEEQKGGEGSEDSNAKPGGEYERAIESAVKRALEEAAREARIAKDIKAVMMKSGVGSGSMLAFDESPEEILRLARETDVEAVLKYVSGLSVVVKEERRMTRHSKGWFRGLEYGSDLERLHPSQLALPDEVFYFEYANSRLLLFEKALPAERGPVYVLLDKSGSMIGEKINWARAVAVALLQRAVKERRAFYARFFDSMVYPLLGVRRAASSREFLKALDYLARVKAGGGTRIMTAIYTASEDIRSRSLPDRVSDIVLITDGEDRINVDAVNRAKKKASARLHTVMIMGDNHYLRKASDNYMEVRRSLDRRSILKVVESLD
ncbi:vWA domain-containing protein [Stetteria hydrogenophila]